MQEILKCSICERFPSPPLPLSLSLSLSFSLLPPSLLLSLLPSSLSLSFSPSLPSSLPLSLPPSLRVSLVQSACSAVQLIRSFLGREKTVTEGINWKLELEETVGHLDLLDLNYALYRCDAEERDEGQGGGIYVVPGAGAFVYCGLEGIMSMLTTVRDNNDLGHPICDNLRSGDWLAGYTLNRLKLKKGTKKVHVSIICALSVHIGARNSVDWKIFMFENIFV